MVRTTIYVTSLIAAMLLCSPAFSQVDEQGKSEVSGQFIGTFVYGTDHDRVHQETSHSGGVLATYRFFFSRNHGVEGSYSYSRSTQMYNFPDGQSGINTNQHEVSGAYVFRLPMKGFTPFLQAGAGALIFDPRISPDASRQTRAAFVYGGGVDLNLGHHVFARAQYRGFVYKSPTFDLFDITLGEPHTLRNPAQALATASSLVMTSAPGNESRRRHSFEFQLRLLRAQE